ncbi:hypothetical protein [Morganella morganii]|uniref:hypothetical protein n=1 Tax=Morganella morganii TaxID=582 RepID=UPI001BD6B21E|nr:hypothetical protein [Morganella morganii]MBS9542807.1 hypothetical protein [Morganella morganii subsp. morganii]MDF2407362.1 hypothetical protein [Morganella morganii]
MPIVIGIVDKATRVTKKAETTVKNGVNVMKAMPGVDYVLVDKQTGSAPRETIIIRDGNNLKLFLAGEEEPSVVIEDYYLFPGQVIGEAENKKVHNYTPKSAMEYDNISNMADKQAAVQQAGTKLLAPITWESFISGWEVLTFLGVAVAGGAAVAIGKSSHSGNDHPNREPPFDIKDNGNTDTDDKDNGNTGTDGKDNGNTGTDDKDNDNTGTDGKDNGNTGTDDKDNGNTGTDDKDNGNTGTDGKDNGNTGTDGKDNGNTAADDQDKTDVPADTTATAVIDDVTDSAEIDPDNLSAVTPVLSGHLDGAPEEGQVVVISRDSDVAGYATVDSSGKWTFNDTGGNFEQGQTYHYTARVEGNGVIGKESEAFSIHYDTTGQHEETETPVLPDAEDSAVQALAGLLSEHEDSLNLDELLSQLPEENTPAENDNTTAGTPDYLQSSAEFMAHDMVNQDTELLTEAQITLF